VPDAAGDTGGFLITSYPDRDAASAVCRGLRSLGIASASPEASNVLLAEYGFHIYSNIPGLREKIGTDARRTPWTLSENRLSRPNYELGACPVADDLFERSVILVIPSCLTAEDEDDILEAFGQVLDGLGALI
jgi:8-amino-3,8-dideoxy-alpha-D-manno-octulosonate transaminase